MALIIVNCTLGPLTGAPECHKRLCCKRTCMQHTWTLIIFIVCFYCRSGYYMIPISTVRFAPDHLSCLLRSATLRRVFRLAALCSKSVIPARGCARRQSFFTIGYGSWAIGLALSCCKRFLFSQALQHPYSTHDIYPIPFKSPNSSPVPRWR